MSETKSKFNRRDFLKGGAGVAVAGLGSSLFSTRAAASSSSIPAPDPSNYSSDSRFWEAVKEQFILAEDSVYMNVGTTGSMPKSVLETFTENNEIVAKYPWDMQNKFGSWPYVSDMIADIAPGFGAEENELILNRNTTDGMMTILHGLDFEKGDIVLTTHHEHIAATSAFHTLEERYGVKVVEVDIPVYTNGAEITPEDYVNAFRDAIYSNNRNKIRLICFSHITYKTGTTLPAKDICKLAIEHDIATLIDGAHTVGMFNLDFHDIDCDFYAGSGHKWQCGPGATGILYVRDNASRIEQIWPKHREPLWYINSSLAESAHLYGSSMAMQYVGNDHYPAKQALTDSCKLWDRIGRQRIEDRVLDLSELCKRKLANKLPDGIFFCPPGRDLSSGLTTFNPFADDLYNGERLTEFRDRLREDYGYIIRTTNFPLHLGDTTDTYALRISTHLFHDEEDVKGLVKAMAQLYKRMA
ncbi:aminotransferase class V-fold PLP-dependent enzyme [Vibrio comitans]|uniref:Aminotransferase n=1 Tax=Vibrio comitans NBRC 102076 TaxID=1219078 RepID=A0A4Y3IT66_9VIBR|nr:aminotransferase class V-fold PLP-dependent enzyme [Vibrio comitans]GEA62084.1 aminotransferase [Vibrio comitans NBRC 102076]